MGTFSIWHWLIVLIYFAVIGIPVSKILQRAGFSRWWTILVFVPLANLVGLWVFALSPWKVADRPA